jgi:hypothetical protein
MSLVLLEIHRAQLLEAVSGSGFLVLAGALQRQLELFWFFKSLRLEIRQGVFWRLMTLYR